MTHFPFQSVLKVELGSGHYTEWRAPPGCFVGETLFVPRGASATPTDGLPQAPDADRQSATVTEPSRAALEGAGKGADSASSSHCSSNGDDNDGDESSIAQAEDDGYLVTLMYDGRQKRSSLVVLDAQSLEEGPLALVHLRHSLPFAFHCMWSANYHMS